MPNESRNAFQTRSPSLEGNPRIRTPQLEAFNALVSYVEEQSSEREVGLVLPVGCGKSGCIALAPFAFRSSRCLVVAPGLRIASQLHKDFDPTQPEMFYLKTASLDGPPFPEPVEIRGTTTNRGDLDEADIVVTNIQQLQGNENRWLGGLPDDYFDLIMFDEGHHNVAATWELLRRKFPAARIVNFSATPLRADGQLMAGRIIYSFPVSAAIQAGYIKRLKALVLNPQTLKYVRRDGGGEVEVSLDEVRRLGEEEADFRRSIVTSTETLNTIVDASVRELDRIRAETGDSRPKIIASALNYEHCRQIVEAYRSRGRRADFVHSRDDAASNDRVLAKLENHELDVIVQVRKLGEGFDHRYLSVAAVFSIFANLSPFIQFVGRIMRVIEQDAPDHPLNRGTVVFHAGANVARRWTDFRTYSEADQEYFDQLLPIEGLDFSDAAELSIEPIVTPNIGLEVSSQSQVMIEEIPLIQSDPDALEALATLRSLGYSPDAVRSAMVELQPVPTTRVYERQAARSALDMRVGTEVGRILHERGISPGGSELDQQRRGRKNYVVLKSAFDRAIARCVNRETGQRSEFTRPELDTIGHRFPEILEIAVQEVFGAEA